jgi:glycosyltransferase involved in cell wall biosynthesis
VIVVDDGSTDDTAMLAAKVGGVRVLRHDWSLGAQAARNTGVRHASHDWIAFQDSDDTWEPEKLARQVAQLDALPDSAEWVLHCDGFRSDRNTGINDRIPIPRFSGHCYEKLLRQPGPMFQGLLVHRSKLDEIGMLDESCPAYQEWDTAIRLARVARFIHVNEPLFHWHWHDGETISKDNSRDFLGFQYVIEKHRAEIERVHGAIGWRRIQAQNLARGLRLGCFARILVLQSTTPKLAYAIAKGLSRLEVCPRRIGGIMQVAALLPV